jgi:hypothetical protein
MDEGMKFTDTLDNFMAFTYLFRYCRPKHEDFFVYEVDAGLPTDYNIVIKAGKFNDTEMIGDYSEMIVAKEWVLENLEKILDKVPQDD